MTTINDRLNEWRKLADAATKGPWEAGDVWVFTDPIYPDTHALADVLGDKWADRDRADAEHQRGLTNAEFIAASREVVPKLLDAVEKVLELCDQLREDCTYHEGREDEAAIRTRGGWKNVDDYQQDIRAALSSALGVSDGE